MSLVDEVSAAIIEAMRRKDAPRLSALRMLKAAFMNREVEKGRALDDGEARQVVQSLVKQRRDSIEEFVKGGRQDLVDKETAEMAVLEFYLPAAADPAVLDLFAEGAMSAAFVPTFTRHLTLRGKATAWHLANNVLTALFLVTAATVAIGCLFARPLVTAYAGEFANVPGKLELTITLTRV